MEINAGENGIFLPRGAGRYHPASHRAYSQAMERALDAIPVERLIQQHGPEVGRRMIADRVEQIMQGGRAILERNGTAQEGSLTISNTRSSPNQAMRGIRTEGQLRDAWIEALRRQGVRFE